MSEPTCQYDVEDKLPNEALYDRVYSALTQQYSALVELDRLAKELNPQHPRRFLSREERRALRQE